MHVIFRESHGLEDAEAPVDLPDESAASGQDRRTGQEIASREDPLWYAQSIAVKRLRPPLGRFAEKTAKRSGAFREDAHLPWYVFSSLGER